MSLSSNPFRNLLIVVVVGMVIVVGCTRKSVKETDPDAPKVERGRLRFAKGLNSLRIGDEYVYRDVTQYFFFDGKPWEPANDKLLASRINWCDTSPNPNVEILRCFSDSSENYLYTYILRVRNDQPEVVKIDEGLGSIWIDSDGRWLLFRKFYFNIDTDEKIPVMGMPFADDKDGSAPVTYVLGISPDKKTVIGSYDLAPDGKDKVVKLRVIDTLAGKEEIRFASLAKYPWLTDHKEPVKDIQPPPAPSARFVWKRNTSGRDVLVEPELLGVSKRNQPAVK